MPRVRDSLPLAIVDGVRCVTSLEQLGWEPVSRQYVDLAVLENTNADVREPPSALTP